MANLEDLTPQQIDEFLKAVGRDPESVKAAEEAAREAQYLSKMKASSEKPFATLGEKLGGKLKEAPTASTAKEAMSVLAPDQFPVPSGKIFDPAELKRKVFEKAAKKHPIATSAGVGAGISLLTGGLYDEGQEELQEQIRRGEKDKPVPGRPGFVFRGSDIVKVGSEGAVAADVLPSMGDIFVKALAPEGSEAQKQAYERIKKTGFGSLVHGKDEIKTDSEQTPSTFEKAKNFLGVISGSPNVTNASGVPASEKDKEETSRLIQQIATSSSIQPRKEFSEEDNKFKELIAKPVDSTSSIEKEEKPEEAIPSKEKETKPSISSKEEKSSLEKMLSDAASKDLEERKKYSDLLNDAIAKRDFTQFIAQLGKATSQIGAGLGGAISRTAAIKPVGGEIYDKMIETAAQPISDLEKRRVLEIEERKMDPESSDSKAARAIMEEFGIKVPKTATAAFLEKQFPAISSLMTRRETIELSRAAAKTRAQEMELKREEIAAHRGKTEQSKIDKDFTKMSEKLTSELASSRSQFGKSASIVRSAEALDAFVKNINPKDITTRQIYELARGLDAMLSQGAATISGTKKLIPETYSGDVARIAEYITTQPKGAGQEAFVKQMMETIAIEKRTAQEQIKRTQGKILSGYKHLKQKDPERYEEVLNEFGLSSSKERASEEKSRSGQKVSSAQLKALVSSKEKNPHEASEAAVARHLINQGFSVEGY